MTRVVEVRLDGCRRATDALGDLCDRETLGLTEVARESNRSAALGHPIGSRRRRVGRHAGSRYLDQLGFPSRSARKCRRTGWTSYPRAKRGRRPLVGKTRRDAEAGPVVRALASVAKHSSGVRTAVRLSRRHSDRQLSERQARKAVVSGGAAARSHDAYWSRADIGSVVAVFVLVASRPSVSA